MMDFTDKILGVAWFSTMTLSELELLNAQGQFVSICVAILAGVVVIIKNIKTLLK